MILKALTFAPSVSLLYFFLVLPLTLSLAKPTALNIRGTFPSSPSYPHYNPSTSLPPSIVVTLTGYGVEKKTLARKDNSFVFWNVTEGEYLVEVGGGAGLEWVFPAIRVDVGKKGIGMNKDVLEVKGMWVVQRGTEWSGADRGYRLEKLELLPLKPTQYFIKREGFSPTRLLGSPMILLALVSLGAVMYIPKLIDMIDPELKAEFEKQQREAVQSNKGLGSMGAFDMAGYLASSSGKEEEKRKNRRNNR